MSLNVRSDRLTPFAASHRRIRRRRHFGFRVAVFGRVVVQVHLCGPARAPATITALTITMWTLPDQLRLSNLLLDCAKCATEMVPRRRHRPTFFSLAQSLDRAAQRGQLIDDIVDGRRLLVANRLASLDFGVGGLLLEGTTIGISPSDTLVGHEIFVTT